MKVLKNIISPNHHHSNPSSLVNKEGRIGGRKVIQIPTDGVKSGSQELSGDMKGWLMLLGAMTLGPLVIILGIFGIIGNIARGR